MQSKMLSCRKYYWVVSDGEMNFKFLLYLFNMIITRRMWKQGSKDFNHPATFRVWQGVDMVNALMYNSSCEDSGQSAWHL